MADPTLLLIDLDNTLTKRRAVYERWAASFVSKYPDVALGRGLQATRRALIAADGSGSVPRDRFCAAIASLFPQGSRPSVDEVWLEFSDAFIEAIDLDPAVNRALDALARRYRLALLSNGVGERQRAKLVRLGLEERFERLIISGEIGCEKPHSGIFEHALRVCGTPAQKALMVGDDPRRDIGGALDAGLRACWIARGRRWAEMGVDATPSLIVEDVPGLAARLLGDAAPAAPAVDLADAEKSAG